MPCASTGAKLTQPFREGAQRLTPGIARFDSNFTIHPRDVFSYSVPRRHAGQHVTRTIPNPKRCTCASGTLQSGFPHRSVPMTPIAITALSSLSLTKLMRALYRVQGIEQQLRWERERGPNCDPALLCGDLSPGQTLMPKRFASKARCFASAFSLRFISATCFFVILVAV